MRIRRRDVLRLAPLFVLTLSRPSAAIAQDLRWLDGAWRGEQWIGTDRDYPSSVVVQFKVTGGSVTWELEIVSPPEGVGNRARGSAKLSGNTLTLDGQYYEGIGKGSILTYTLERRRGGDELSGVGHGKTTFNALWTRVK